MDIRRSNSILMLLDKLTLLKTKSEQVPHKEVAKIKLGEGTGAAAFTSTLSVGKIKFHSVRSTPDKSTMLVMTLYC